jgi:predicted amidohydrolase
MRKRDLGFGTRDLAAKAMAVMVTALLVQTAAASDLNVRSMAGLPPRKVIVGTSMQAFWGKYPGLTSRLEQLTGLVDQMAAEAQRKYGRGLDLAVLPETAVTGETSSNVMADAVPLEGSLREAFAKKAREQHCYIVVPTYLLEDKEKKLCSNAAILFGRDGEVVGIYRKIHLAVPTGSDSLEGGTTPGKEAPVFACDFGKLGMQICFDIEYDYGWSDLARQGAELVAWPTQSPQTVRPAARAMENRYYVVSSTWRNNAAIFEPTGRITAQIREPAHVLVEQIDLSYAILPWSSQLHNGAALRERYGEKVGFHYYEDEDRGIFWSNDPHTTIGDMMRSLGLSEQYLELRRIRNLLSKAGAPE